MKRIRNLIKVCGILQVKVLQGTSKKVYWKVIDDIKTKLTTKFQGVWNATNR